jgi:hypothetical protein
MQSKFYPSNFINNIFFCIKVYQQFIIFSQKKSFFLTWPLTAIPFSLSPLPVASPTPSPT